MTTSLLAAVRGAMHAESADDFPEGEATGARPQNQEGKTDMSAEQRPAPAGISQADNDSAVATAETRGREAGTAEATARLSAALGAEGVKGDAGRMAAALDLAVKSPAMSGADVAAYVVANVAAAKPSEQPDAAAYERQRLSGLAAPQPAAPADAGASTWGKAAERINKRNS